MSASLVTVRDLHKVYYRGSERIDVLQGVNLDIPQGDFLALMGPSGSGKTTLLNLIGGLDTPTEGSIEVAGDRIDKLSGGKLAAWRARHIGFVFQMYNLLPVLTAERNVELPLLLTQLGAAERKQARAGGAERSSGSAIARSTTRASCRAARSSASASRAPSSPTRRCCSATSRPATSIASRATRSSTCCSALNREHGKTIVMVTHDPHAAGARQAHAAPRQGPARAGGGRMKFLPLVWRNLLRRKMRTFFTMLSILVAFVLFGVLMAIRAAFSMGVEVAGADRLMVIHKVSIIQPLPQSYWPEDPRGRRASRTSPTPTGSAATTRTRATSSRTSRSTPRAGCACIRSSCCRRNRRRPGSPIAPAPSSASTRRRDSAGRSATTFR